MIFLRKKLIENSREKTKRTFRFGFIALVVMLMNSALDFLRGLNISGILILAMVFAINIILLITYRGYTRGTVAAIIFTINPLLVLIAFAEGLKTGGYLFILPLLLAQTFMTGNIKIHFFEMAVYFFITVASFCTCILFCNETSEWQHISTELYSTMFTFNSICVVCLCAVFAYTGIYFEKQYKAALLIAKNKAETQEQKIKGQNEHLQEIAFMNAHIVRLPVANILALSDLINTESIDAGNKELIEHIQTSAHQLDDAIRKIVSKTAG